MPPGPPLEYRFGRFRLVPGERRLWDGDRPVKLGGRALDTLVVLVHERERAVPKGELMERVWPRLVVEENNLQVQIASLRRILGRDAIATIPGRGYQFTQRLTDADDAGPPRPQPRAHDLPRPLTRFVGREADVAELAQALAGTRLLTLTGIGGCGKTRLAIELAEAVLPTFADGVRFVDLASVAEPARVALCSAAVVGIREEPETPIEETLIHHLAGRQLLLVLDNCEHLLAACATLAERLLRALPRLHVLVTSREGFGIAGERVVPVRSLSFPAQGTRDTAALLEHEAVRLFVARVRDVAPDFRLDAGNALAVGDVCRRLDGIPLALELAAARARVLSVEQIRARLDDRFRFLTGSSRAMSRHQTLLATLQWSYEHLTPVEQSWLRCLSVFAGGWTLDAAVAVAGEGCDEVEAAERLARLFDQSLVSVERRARDEPRYAMLETVRQYAQDRLLECGESEVLRDRHFAYFLALAKRAHPALFTRDAGRWYRRLDQELSNLLAAHAWCDRAPAGAARGLEFASELRLYWVNRGLYTLGRQLDTEALARDGARERSIERARALFALGQHLDFFGRFGEAIAPLEEALAIARERGDDECAADCLEKLAYARALLGDAAGALACSDEELASTRPAGGYGLISALVTRSAVCRMRGDLDAAAAALEEALSLEAGDNVHASHVIRSELARVSIARGSLVQARTLLAEAIRLLNALGSTYQTMVALNVAALLAAAHGDWSRAVRLQATFDVALDAMGGYRNPHDDDRVLTELRHRPRAMLDGASRAAADAAGREMSLDAALDDALAWIERLG
jgi:non-specific serine/threonine protein kinase